MKCLHCGVAFVDDIGETKPLKYASRDLEDESGAWVTLITVCPECKKASIIVGALPPSEGPATVREQVWPRDSTRRPPAGVPAHFGEDFTEASIVLPYSPKASAALSRRCLQRLLREHGHVKPADLCDEIEEVLASKVLPSDLAAQIDAVRHVGNFAAHPLKSKQTGLVLDVEPGEAEWLLDVLDELFDFYFVRPTRIAEKRSKLDEKLREAGKPPLKGPP